MCFAVSTSVVVVVTPRVFAERPSSAESVGVGVGAVAVAIAVALQLSSVTVLA